MTCLSEEDFRSANRRNALGEHLRLFFCRPIFNRRPWPNRKKHSRVGPRTRASGESPERTDLFERRNEFFERGNEFFDWRNDRTENRWQSFGYRPRKRLRERGLWHFSSTRWNALSVFSNRSRAKSIAGLFRRRL